MENIYIKKTKKTPEVMFDTNGVLKISGRCIPEDPSKFYEPLYIWVLEYCSNPQPNTLIEIDLEYFNSGSSKSILYLLRDLVDHKSDHHHVKINWYYEEGDEDIKERGEYFASILNTEISFIEKE